MNEITRQLTDKIRLWAPATGDYLTGVDGLLLLRRDEIFRHDNIYAEPRLLVGLQGCKYTLAGKSEYWIGQNQLQVLDGHLISSSRTPGACPAKPFLSLSLNLDALLVKCLLEEAPYLSRPVPEDFESHTTALADTGLMEALLRLVTLLDKPPQIPYLAPLFIKEIHYRLLLGPLNSRLQSLCRQNRGRIPLEAKERTILN